VVRLAPAEQLARHVVGPLKRRSSKAQSNYLSNWCRNCGVPLGSHLLGEELLAAEKPFDRYPISGDMMALLLVSGAAATAMDARGQNGWSRGCRRQNSLPSGSARTCQLSVPVWPTSAGLAPRASSRSQFGVLVAVGGVDVDMQSELPGPRVAAGAEDEGGLRTAEAGVGRPDLDASVVLPTEFDVAEDGAPECGEPVGVGGVDDQFTDAACHARQCT